MGWSMERTLEIKKKTNNPKNPSENLLIIIQKSHVERKRS